MGCVGAGLSRLLVWITYFWWNPPLHIFTNDL